MSVKLLLVRHGRVDFDAVGPEHFVEGPRGRQWNPPLDERGREQARRLGLRLSLMPRPELIAVSPLLRCHQTLQPYLDGGRAEPLVEPDLTEVFIGDWEGVRFEDILAGDEELARKFREQEPMFALAPNGESGPELRRRVVPVVERLLAEVGEGTLLVVAHGGVINAYLGHVMGIEHDMFFLPDNGSINTVEVDGERRRIRFLNDVRHLTDPAVFSPPAGTRPAGSRSSA